MKINTGSKIALVACSNAQSKANEEKINELMSKLQSIGYHPVLSDFIYETDSYFSGTGQERANALMDAYRDDEVKAIRAHGAQQHPCQTLPRYDPRDDSDHDSGQAEQRCFLQILPADG